MTLDPSSHPFRHGSKGRPKGTHQQERKGGLKGSLGRVSNLDTKTHAETHPTGSQALALHPSRRPTCFGSKGRVHEALQQERMGELLSRIGHVQGLDTRITITRSQTEAKPLMPTSQDAQSEDTDWVPGCPIQTPAMSSLAEETLSGDATTTPQASASATPTRPMRTTSTPSCTTKPSVSPTHCSGLWSMEKALCGPGRSTIS